MTAALRFERRVRQSRRLARACAWLEALLFAASAALLARTAARADAAVAPFEQATSGRWLELLCAALAGWIAWRERRGAHERWLARWDERLELRGALVTAHEHRGAASSAARALLARVAHALPSLLGLCRRAPLPFAALAVAVAALAVWWGTTPLVFPPWHAPAEELTALARDVSRAEARLAGRTPRADADRAVPATAATPTAARSSLDAARGLLGEAARSPQDAALTEQARALRERLRASGALDDVAAASTSTASGSNALGNRAPSAAESLGVAPAWRDAPRLRPSQREAELAARWTESRRARLSDTSGDAR